LSWVLLASSSLTTSLVTTLPITPLPLAPFMVADSGCVVLFDNMLSVYGIKHSCYALKTSKETQSESCSVFQLCVANFLEK
jgi:hypothetical protein